VTAALHASHQVTPCSTQSPCVQLFCAHMHPLDMPKATQLKKTKLPGVKEDSLVHYVYSKGDAVSGLLRDGGCSALLSLAGILQPENGWG
jgi:hypothetical protein